MQIKKVEGGLSLEIPRGIAESLGLREGQRFEVVPVKEDVLVIVLKEVQTKRGSKTKIDLSDEEIQLLKKLNSIRFSDRTGDNMQKRLDKKELKVLDGLVKRGVVLHIKHGKYSSHGGVYSISREYFKAINEMVSTKRETPDRIRVLLDGLAKNGFIILDDQGLAEEFALALSSEMRDGDVTAIKTFDKKIVFVSSELVNKLGDRVVDILKRSKRGMGIQTIASKLGADPDAIRAVIEILREAGDILEKRKGVYVVA